MVLHQESGGGAVPSVHQREAGEAGQLVVGLCPSWGCARRGKKKVEIIEEELQKLVRRGLDGAWVFHTLYRRRVAPLAERTQPMWKYNGPTDPNRASPEELPDDEVWSRLDRVL